jgi:hypothetical protein
MQLRSQLKLPNNKFKLKKLNLQKRDVRQKNPQVQNKPQVQKNQHMKDRTPAYHQATRRRQSSPVSVPNKIFSRMDEKEHNTENQKS